MLPHSILNGAVRRGVTACGRQWRSVQPDYSEGLIIAALNPGRQGRTVLMGGELSPRRGGLRDNLPLDSRSETFSWRRSSYEAEKACQWS